MSKQESQSGSGSGEKLTVGVFNFGKYKGEKIEQVFEEDEKYCLWFLQKVDDKSKHKRYVKQKIQELLDNQ